MNNYVQSSLLILMTLPILASADVLVNEYAVEDGFDAVEISVRSCDPVGINVSRTLGDLAVIEVEITGEQPNQGQCLQLSTKTKAVLLEGREAVLEIRNSQFVDVQMEAVESEDGRLMTEQAWISRRIGPVARPVPRTALGVGRISAAASLARLNGSLFATVRTNGKTRNIPTGNLLSRREIRELSRSLSESSSQNRSNKGNKGSKGGKGGKGGKSSSGKGKGKGK